MKEFLEEYGGIIIIAILGMSIIATMWNVIQMINL